MPEFDDVAPTRLEPKPELVERHPTLGEDETWIAPLRMSRRVWRLSKDDELDGEAWLDEEGRLVALAHDGELLRVMPFPRRKKQKKKAT